MGSPSEAQKATEQFRNLLDREATAQSREMVRNYAPVYQRLQKDTNDLVRIAQSRGLKPWQVMRMDRMKDLESQYLRNVDRWAKASGETITQAQRNAVGLSRRSAKAVVTAGLPDGVNMNNLARLGIGWNELPEDAFANFIGISQDGAPVGRLLADLGPDSAPKIRGAIGAGIALGKGPRQTAQLVRKEAGLPLSKALLITRTETTRAFREATRLQYGSNSQVVKGYKRLAARSDRTCPACIALDGERYELDEPLNEHPNGRCSMVPDVLDYADLGLDIPRVPEPPNARDWLAQQPELVQRKILGDTRFEAWKAGKLQLNQMASVRHSNVWGDSAVVRSLKDMPIDTRTWIAEQKVATKAPGVVKEPPVVRPSEELFDPKTGEKVRGTRTTPPEPFVPDDFVGDPDDFLDVSGDSGRGRVKQQVNEQVREQEAWARAVGGAVEADYQGLSILAAQQVNKAVEVTIVRNGWRPLDIITTKRDPRRGGGFGRAHAYQIDNAVHINAASSSSLRGAAGRLEKGSVRAWDKRNLADNAYVKKEHQMAGERLSKLETEVANKRAIYAEWKKKGDKNALISDPELEARRIRGEPMTGSEYMKWIKDYEKSIKDAKKQLGKTASERWSPTTGDEYLKEVITHEIGHYAHRRWGFHERSSRMLLGGKKGKEHARQLSEYALKNDIEHFAEAFTEHIWLGGERNSPEVTAFIEDVIKANTNYPDRERVFQQ